MSNGSPQVNRKGNMGVCLETRVDRYLENCWGRGVQEQYIGRWLLDKCTVAKIMLNK